MKDLKSVLVAFVAAISLVFTACNGGNGGGDVTPPLHPDSVRVTFSKVTTDTIVADFELGKNVSGISFILLKKGDMQNQIDQFGPIFGFDDAEGYLNMFGAKISSDTSFTFPGNKPNYDYELYVLPTMQSGEKGEMVSFYVTTLGMGGSGKAMVTIEIGEFDIDTIQGTEGQDSLIFLNKVTVIPNDQCALYRYLLMDKDSFDAKWSDEKIVEYLSNETDPNFPPNIENPYWNLYTPDIDIPYYVDPEHSYYVLALGKNADDKYGDLCKKEFSTPAVENKGKSANSKAVAVRIK